MERLTLHPVVCVALYMRAWIEVIVAKVLTGKYSVALYMRAWIEVRKDGKTMKKDVRRPLHEGVD